jgi:hypothetical protein
MCADASLCACVRILRRPACAHRHESIRTHADTHTQKHPHYVDQHTCSSALLRYICVPYYCMRVLIPDPPAGAAPGFVVHRNDSLESRLSALTSHHPQVLLCYMCCICVRILGSLYTATIRSSHVSRLLPATTRRYCYVICVVYVCAYSALEDERVCSRRVNTYVAAIRTHI